jgi:NADH:ubiquinone oxidoreductase subunit H
LKFIDNWFILNNSHNNFYVNRFGSFSIGLLPLIERKYLSILQRRVGPDFVGYKGRFQFIVDALKIFLKQFIKISKVKVLLYLAGPISILCMCYFLFINTFWDINLILIDIEYNMLYLTILTLLFNFAILITAIYSNSKYAALSAIRVVILMFCLELLVSLLYLNLYIFLKSFNFSIALTIQNELPSLLMFIGAYSLLIIIIFMEINRCPFDLAEAESELIAGFHTEYGAFFFGLFYLSEYFHMFFTIIVTVTLFIGL